MKPILLVGGGGHCHSCIDVIEAGQAYKIVGVVERDDIDLSGAMGYSIIGNDRDLHNLLIECPSALVTVGQIKSANIRIRLFNLLKELNAELPIIVSPQAYVSKHAHISSGTIIMHGSVVNPNVVIRENCIINSQALIEHDAVIESHCHVSTGAIINGGVTVGQGSFIGSGAIIKEGIQIGTNCVIGAGVVVLQNISSRTTFLGKGS